MEQPEGEVLSPLRCVQIKHTQTPERVYLIILSEQRQWQQEKPPAPSAPPQSPGTWKSGWSARTWESWAPDLHKQKGRCVNDFHILNSVLVGDTENKEILQAQHPSTALLLPFSISPLLSQMSEMAVLDELWWKVLSDTTFYVLSWQFFFLQVLLVLASPSMPFQIRKNRDGEKTLKACQSKQRICSVCQLGKSIIHVIHTAKLVGRKGLSAEFPDRTPQMPHCPTNPSAKVPTPTPGSIRGDFQPCPSLTSPGMGTRNPSLTDPQLH